MSLLGLLFGLFVGSALNAQSLEKVFFQHFLPRFPCEGKEVSVKKDIQTKFELQTGRKVFGVKCIKDAVQITYGGESPFGPAVGPMSSLQRLLQR